MKTHTPDVVLKQMPRLEGLCLLMTHRGAHRSLFLKELLQTHNESSKITLVQDHDLGFKIKQNLSLISTAEVIENSNLFSSDTTHFYVISEEPKMMKWALTRAEEGYGVILFSSCLNFETGLNRFADEISENTEFAMRKISRVLKVALEIKSVESLLGQTFAMQCYLQRPELQELLAQCKFHELNQAMEKSDFGAFTMNQSLAELVITRKIDFKGAFSASQNPSELDGLLKRAGV